MEVQSSIGRWPVIIRLLVGPYNLSVDSLSIVSGYFTNGSPTYHREISGINYHRHSIDTWANSVGSDAKSLSIIGFVRHEREVFSLKTVMFHYGQNIT